MVDSPLAEGPSAKVAAAAARLGDSSLSDADRISAARALGELGRQETEARAACASALAGALEGYNENSRALNNALILALVALKARESVVLVGRVLHEHRADETVTGAWEQVRYDLGVGPPPFSQPGESPQRPPDRQSPAATTRPSSAGQGRSGRTISPAERAARRDRRKQAAKSRKRNRRRGR